MGQKLGELNVLYDGKKLPLYPHGLSLSLPPCSHSQLDPNQNVFSSPTLRVD